MVEEVAGAWLKELLGLPGDASFGFVTGAQGANTVGLAAARHRVLEHAGWDVERDGLTARRGCGWWRARSATRRSTARCGCSASATGAVEAVAAGANGAIDPAALAAALEAGGGRRSSASRPAT